MPRVILSCLMASAGAEGTEEHVAGSPGVVKAAILERAVGKVRKVRRADRMIERQANWLSTGGASPPS